MLTDAITTESLDSLIAWSAWDEITRDQLMTATPDGAAITSFAQSVYNPVDDSYSFEI